jgi:hypothetical protein
MNNDTRKNKNKIKNKNSRTLKMSTSSNPDTTIKNEFDTYESKDRYTWS